MRRTRRGLLLVLLALLGASVAVVAGAAPAGAHAVVVSSSPAADERLSASPTEVSFVFSEAVTSDLGGITVLTSPSGERVDNDDTTQLTATSVRASLPPDLPDGAYVAQYKVISADGHPISGAVVFGIGDAQIGDVGSLASATDPLAERLSTFARFLTYTAALLAAGLAFFAVFLHDGGSDRRQLTSIVQIATIVAAIGAALTIAAQAALATGDGLGAATQIDVLRGVLREGLGWSTAVLFVGLALCHISVTARPSAIAQALTFYGALAITTSFVFWGHALEAPNTWLAISADVVHVAVAAAWFGGLVGLTLTLRTRTRTARTAGLPEPTLLVGHPGVTTATGGAGAPTSTAALATSAPGRTATAVLDRPGDTDDAPGPPARDEHLGDDAHKTEPTEPADLPDLSNPSDRPEPGSLRATVAIVRRFSTIAAVSLGVLAVSGLALGWQELGSLGAVTASTYGQALLVKLALVAVIVVLAGYNRFLLLPWLLAEDTSTTDDTAITDDTGTDPDPDPDATTTETSPPAAVSRTQVDEGLEAGWRTLLRTVTVEALVIVAVLAVTAVLVNAVPGRAEAGPTGPFTESRPFRDGTISLTVTPNQPGSNSFHVDFTGPDGRPADLAQKVTLDLRLPEKGIGPLEEDLLKGGTGHFFLEGVTDLSIAGTWEITLNVRVTDFDQERVTFTDRIG